MRPEHAQDKSIVVVGLGSIGSAVARRLDAGLPGLRLTAVCDRDEAGARTFAAGLRSKPDVVTASQIQPYDIVVEAAGAGVLPALFAALQTGQTLVACSVGALVDVPDLEDRVRASGGRLIIPSGALGGLDAVRAAAEGQILSISIETRKPPQSLAGAPYIVQNGIDLDGITNAECVFEGSARDAAKGFPANINVGAALALAGVGADSTVVRIIADPSAARNVHTVRMESDSVRMTLELEGLPSPTNPKTSSLTPHSVVAALRGLVAPVKVGG